jgi:hypothetical protein
MLQHSLMHMKFAVRAAVLISLDPEKLKTFALKHLNELAGGPWSFLNSVRRMAISCMREHDSKEKRIRWLDDQSIQCAWELFPQTHFRKLRVAHFRELPLFFFSTHNTEF